MSTGEDSTDTKRLLDRALDGDRLAIDRLFDRHLPAVKTSIRRRVSPRARARFDASDVIQETHRTAREKFDDFLSRRPMSFRLWLIMNAQQRLVDLERRHILAAKRAIDREVPLPDASSLNLLGALASKVKAPEDALVAKEQAQVVRRCLAQLAELDRQVLMLRIFDGLKNIDVSAVLEITPDAAKKRFARAIERLRMLLVEAGIEEIT